MSINTNCTTQDKPPIVAVIHRPAAPFRRSYDIKVDANGNVYDQDKILWHFDSTKTKIGRVNEHGDVFTCSQSGKERLAKNSRRTQKKAQDDRLIFKQGSLSPIQTNALKILLRKYSDSEVFIDTCTGSSALIPIRNPFEHSFFWH
jgi:hypothetical protein